MSDVSVKKMTPIPTMAQTKPWISAKPAPLMKMLRLIITKWVVGKKKASILISGPMRLNGMSRPDMKKPEKKKMIMEAIMATCWLLTKTDRNREMLIVANR